VFDWALINDNITEGDKKTLSDFILNSNRFTNGPKVKEFEEVWSKWLGVKYSVMVGSGAAANYITTAIVREKKSSGGEIIVPTIGWVSDISSVVNTGFTPVFVDVDMSTLAITYENIKNAINKKTKAIVLVHALGFNGITDEIIKLAKENDLLLIEDCCESHGATHNGQKVGSFGVMSCFSFYFGHHMTTIEGGMVCTNDEEIYQLARMFRSHGMTREASPKTQEKYFQEDLNPLFTFAVPGYNMRSTEINAVLGLEQINRLDYNCQCRVDNLQTWLENLNGKLYFKDYLVKGNSSFALPLILSPESGLNNSERKQKMKKICTTLENNKVEYRIGTAGGGNQMRQPYLKKFDFKAVGNFDNSNFVHDYGLYIGNHPELRREQIRALCLELNDV
jgi:CDP-4-dehydro-6-deoxyglucose reductase, E1